MMTDASRLCRRNAGVQDAAGLGTGLGAATMLGLFLGGVAIDIAPAHARPSLPDGVRARSTGLDITAGDHFQTGRALLASGDTASALAAFRMAVESDPRNVDALNGIGVAYDRLGRADLARNAYEAALEADPAAGDVLYNLGYSLYRAGEAHAAIAPLQKAINNGDARVQAAARRVLALVGSALTTAQARAGIAAPPAVLALAPEAGQAPAATVVMAAAAPARTPAPALVSRIEMSGTGETQLVLAPASAPAELMAALGEQAALVTVTARMTPQQEMDMDAAYAGAGVPGDGDVAGDQPAAMASARLDLAALHEPAVRPEALAAPRGIIGGPQMVRSRAGAQSPLVAALLAAMDHPKKGLESGWNFALGRDDDVSAPADRSEPGISLDAMMLGITDTVTPAAADETAGAAGTPVALAEAISRLEALIAAAQAAQA